MCIIIYCVCVLHEDNNLYYAITSRHGVGCCGGGGGV